MKIKITYQIDKDRIESLDNRIDMLMDIWGFKSILKEYNTDDNIRTIKYETNLDNPYMRVVDEDLRTILSILIYSNSTLVMNKIEE